MKHQIEVTVYTSKLDNWQKNNQSDPDWQVRVCPWSVDESENTILIGKQMIEIEAPDMKGYDPREKQIAILEAELKKKRAEAYKEQMDIEHRIQNLLALGHSGSATVIDVD